jgi:hypothetical protein
LAGKVTEKIVGSRNGAQTVAFSPSTSTRPYARPTRLKAGRSVRVRPREGPPSLLAVVSATGRFVRASTLHRCGQPIWAGREAPITARFTFWWSNDQDLDTPTEVAGRDKRLISRCFPKVADIGHPWNPASSGTSTLSIQARARRGHRR